MVAAMVSSQRRCFNGVDGAGGSSEPLDVVEAARDVAALASRTRPRSRTAATAPSGCRGRRRGRRAPPGRTACPRSPASSATRSSSQPSPDSRRRPRLLVEIGDAGLDQLLVGRVLGGLLVVALDRDGVEAVGHLVVRIDVARHLDQRRHGFGLQRRVSRPQACCGLMTALTADDEQRARAHAPPRFRSSRRDRPGRCFVDRDHVLLPCLLVAPAGALAGWAAPPGARLMLTCSGRAAAEPRSGSRRDPRRRRTARAARRRG